MDIENTKKDDPSTAILNVKKAPNKLVVDQAEDDDDVSTVKLHPEKLNELNIMVGDPVLLIGKRRRTTLCIALENDSKDAKEGNLYMSRGTRKNLNVKLADTVTVKTPEEVPNLTKVDIRPFDDTIEGVTGDITQTFLAPYFKDAFRPLHKGDCFTVRGNFKAVEFKVFETEPKEYGIYAANTV